MGQRTVSKWSITNFDFVKETEFIICVLVLGIFLCQDGSKLEKLYYILWLFKELGRSVVILQIEVFQVFDL